MDKFNKLKEQILKCKICEEKLGFTPHPILLGNSNSKIMQISQAPSQNVHITFKPFNDLSGKKLKKEWYQIDDSVFYNPDNFYIAAMAHCYPGKSGNGGDRQPPQICAKTWVEKEIELVNNKLYIMIGSKSANYFFPNADFNSLIFRNNIFNNKPAIVLPHPSPLNIKWFKDNPRFLKERLPEIRKLVHNILNIEYTPENL